MPVKKQLIIFDFDWSLIDQDTDRWIFEHRAPDVRRKMEDLGDQIEWTDLVAQCLKEIHERGITREEIERSLRIIPFHPAMVRGVKTVKAAQNPHTAFLCLSSANQVFIDTVLASRDLDDLFDEIITNPAEWDESGLLKLGRRIDPSGPQHNCQIGCYPNICKGEELTEFIARHGEYDRMIYIGDGSNDFCPALRLRPQDFLLCRRNRGLEKRIITAPEEHTLKCTVKKWEGAWEVEEIFHELSSQLD